MYLRDHATAVGLVGLALVVGLAGCATTGTPLNESENVTADGLRTDAVAAIEDVEHYRIESTQTQRVSAGIVQETRVETEGAFDRADRRARLNLTQESLGRTTEVDTYLADESLYLRSEAFVRQYGSRWVRQPVDNYSRIWTTQDVIARQHDLLEVATVSLNGTGTVDGERARKLDADVSPAAYRDLATGLFGPGSNFQSDQLEIGAVNVTYWLDTETDLPLRSVARLELSVVAGGQEVDLDQTVSIRYLDYGESVSVDLPPAAEDAVEIPGSGTVGPTGGGAVTP
jgi:hypothetical protein